MSTSTIHIYDLAEMLAGIPVETQVKSMHTLETVGSHGPETLETGLVRLELALPDRRYIRESSFTRHPNQQYGVSFSRPTTFIRSTREPAIAIVDDNQQPIDNDALCTFINELPHVQHYDLTVFDR